MNALKDLMAFADENEMFGRGWSDSASSYNPKSRRALWAAEMMGQGQMQRPDFFGGEMQQQAPAYQAPERMAPTQPRQMMGRMQPQIQNFLARLLGR